MKKRLQRWVLQCGICGLAILSLGSVSATAQSLLWVPNGLSNSVSIIDTATNTVTATVPFSAAPGAVAFTPDGAFAWVSFPSLGTISVLDARTRAVVATISGFDGPSEMVFTPSGTKAYVADGGFAVTSDKVRVVDTSTKTIIATLTIAPNPTHGMFITPNGNFVYVASPSSVSVIDTTADAVVATLTGFPAPAWISMSSVGKSAYVTNSQNNGGRSTVQVIDLSSNTIVASIDQLGGDSRGSAVTPDSAFLYTSALCIEATPCNEVPLQGNVAVIQTSTRTEIADIPLFAPVGVAVNPNGSFVYVVEGESSDVAIISTSTNTVVGHIPVGNSPGYPVFEPPLAGKSFFLHGIGGLTNPLILFLDKSAPTVVLARYRDSAGIKFGGGDPWREIGIWLASPALTNGTLISLNDLHVWLGLKDSDDQGTRFDLRAEIRKNGTLIASGETYCIQSVSRDPGLAKEVTVSFGANSPANFHGITNVLSLRVLTRIGTNGSGGFCGGHNNADGLRLYFDSVSRPARFSAAF